MLTRAKSPLIIASRFTMVCGELVRDMRLQSAHACSHLAVQMDVLASAQHRSTADLVPRRRIDVLGSVVERLFSWQERVHVGKVPRQGLHPGRKV